MKLLYQDLEYEKIKNLISTRCHSQLGRLQAELIEPMQDKAKIIDNLQLNHEIQTCIKHGIEFSFVEIVDIQKLFEDDASIVFSYEEFLDIYHNVYCANTLASAAGSLKEYQKLYRKLERITPLPELASRFVQIFDSEGEVLDTASPELHRIRKQINHLNAKIARTMNSLLQDVNLEKYLQDKFITQRNDRYVIPVKESAVPYVRGIVQSKSATKSTVFIEPESIVPLSNELQLLRQEEKNEIYRIFLAYSKEIRAFASRIISNTKHIAELDMRFAIGRLAHSLMAKVPVITAEPIVSMKDARHPLLYLKLQDRSKVIPFDVALGKDFRLMVLSGPNTGGKTVLLKSVGLITLMALSGIPVPLSEDSEIGIFSGIFADIGDDQSIENALSTFSSHIDKIRRMLETCDERSLILIDEIGAATDPQQGSALAQVVLERFASKSVLGIVTTHYTALKVFAEKTDACINASMQFDMKSLQPTYRFVAGFPGDSFAIEVASSLGLDRELIDRAKTLSGSQSIEFTELLKNMQELKKQLAREQYEYQLKNRNLQARIDELEKRNSEFEAELKQRKQQYLKELQKELIAHQKAYTSELNEIRNLGKEERKLRSESKISELVLEQQKLSSEIRQMAPQGREPISEISIGDKVWLADFETDATLLELNGQDALVDMNGISFKTLRSNLYASDQKKEVIAFVKAKSSVSAPKVRMEIKLLGLTFDEAQPIIDEAIDEALVAGFHTLRIVHGKGTGALRNKVQAYLKRKKQVISISIPPPEAGGSGVTIANF